MPSSFILGTIHMYNICRKLMSHGLSSCVLEYLIWSSICMESSVPLMTIKYLKWRVQFYTLVCQCYYDLKADQEAEEFAKRGLKKVVYSIAFSCLFCFILFCVVRRNWPDIFSLNEPVRTGMNCCRSCGLIITVTINIIKIKALFWLIYLYPSSIYLFKVNNGNTRTMGQWRRSGVFIVNFDQISRIVLVFPLLNLNK